MSEGFTQDELAVIRRLLPKECANDARFAGGNVKPDEDCDKRVHIYANGYVVEITKCSNFWHVVFSTSSGNFIEKPLSESIANAKSRFMDRVKVIQENEK